jgi:hypothetical protein
MEKKKNYSHGTFSAMLMEGLKSNFESDAINIESGVEFLSATENGFVNKNEIISLEIPIVNELPDILKPEG